jgi:hypothetical protein
MADQPTGKGKLAQEKRDLARRARRLAQAQLEPERSRLARFATELEHEADALERSAASISLPPVAAPVQQVLQQQSAQVSPPCIVSKETE